MIPNRERRCGVIEDSTVPIASELRVTVFYWIFQMAWEVIDKKGGPNTGAGHQHRRSIKTLRLHYGLEGMKYIFQMYEGEINGHGEKEVVPTEYQYEIEQ